MSDSITIYWSDELNNPNVTPMLMYPLGEKALASMDLPDPKEFPDASIKRCPGFMNYYRNCFVIRSPIDIRINFEEGEYRWETSISDQGAIDDLVQVRDASGMMTLGFFLHVFADQEVNAEQIHPVFMEGEYVQKCDTICGHFDISQWFRPLQPAMRLRNVKGPESVDIKRGDPLYLVRLNTEKKLVLKKFRPNAEIKEIAGQISAVKNSTYRFYTSLTNYYKVFKMRKIRQRLIDEIEKNIIPG